ncbi:DNA replication complex GINS protein PSF1-like [Pollicipes pollicipes]|uniref:DNA replication complex GINS protein PSF1-like n=1 Tax=Pollicipes pollicipes TaxID=41117 RepID=UPI0018855411|nr:DNA replication complex GINS protein PSF1-like [Pollicipes pollicipes]
MLTSKALELIRELKRSPDSLPPYNEESVRLVLQEVRALFDDNRRDVVDLDGSAGSNLSVAVWVRHAAIERNRRCLLAYLYHRLRSIGALRWSFGSVLPPDVKQNLSEAELAWFGSYSRSLAGYMRSIGETGLNLTDDLQPPKHLYIEVRCMEDYGEFETDEGDVVLLKKNSIHFLPRAQCQHLVRQGVLRHVVH